MKRGRYGTEYKVGSTIHFGTIEVEVVHQSVMRTFTTIKHGEIEKRMLTQLLSK